MGSLDTEIDRLYQLPLNEFTAARAALAKTAGAKAGEVRTLAKPSLPAWAVNQLYFRDRAAYDRLTATADALRRAHKAVLEGKKADLREADKAHDEAVDAALRKTLALLEQSGHPVTGATRDAVSRTLHALPAAGVEPGRLTKPLAPGGFSMLEGITVRPGRVVPFRRAEDAERKSEDAEAQRSQRSQKAQRDAEAARKKALEAQRKAHAAAQRTLKAARQKDARVRQELARAEARVERARTDAKRAADDLDDAQRAVERFK